MKSLTFTGLILLAISALLFYITTDFTVEQIKISHIMGMMAGVGVGLIIGGMVGYLSKGNAIKAEQKKKEFKRLQKEKEELEKQATKIANRHGRVEDERNDKNPQI